MSYIPSHNYTTILVKLCLNFHVKHEVMVHPAAYQADLNSDQKPLTSLKIVLSSLFCNFLPFHHSSQLKTTSQPTAHPAYPPCLQEPASFPPRWAAPWARCSQTLSPSFQGRLGTALLTAGWRRSPACTPNPAPALLHHEVFPNLWE